MQKSELSIFLRWMSIHLKGGDQERGVLDILSLFWAYLQLRHKSEISHYKLFSRKLSELEASPQHFVAQFIFWTPPRERSVADFSLQNVTVPLNILAASSKNPFAHMEAISSLVKGGAWECIPHRAPKIRERKKTRARKREKGGGGRKEKGKDRAKEQEWGSGRNFGIHKVWRHHCSVITES